ncbi:MAG TPA: cytochrome P450 [Ktedonobacteraceae bacterium]
MTTVPGALSAGGTKDGPLSLYHLLDPEVLANPYPLYQRLRQEAPVHWDPFLHTWIVTRYADVITVFQKFSAERTPTVDQMAAMGLEALTPLAEVMVKQMLFLDPPDHGRIRGLASKAFTPRRVEGLREHIREITETLLDAVQDKGEMDIIADLAYPLPAIVTAEMLGVPTSDWPLLTRWSADFAQVLGNFQHNPDNAAQVVKSLGEMIAYFHEAIRETRKHPGDGLINAYLSAEVNGDRFTEEEVVANTIVTMVGGQETTTNLIGNGVLALLRHPDQLARLKADLSLIPSAVEELLRYESPSQHTARLAPEDIVLGGKQIRKRQAVIAVMGAANRDPERFPDPDRLDLGRQDNRHVAFAWASHFCFGAPLARIEGQIAFERLVTRMPDLALKPGKIIWRENLGLRGLTTLPVTFGNSEKGTAHA